MSAELFFGVAGWSYKDWEGRVYPEKKPKGFHPIHYLAGFLDAVEINSTFYHPGNARNARSWAQKAAAAPGFRLTVKLWQRFTHDREEFGDDEVRQARLVPEILADAGVLGAVLIQFPWSFRNTPENRGRLFRVFEALSGLPLAVEMRHGSWDTTAFRQTLADREVALVNVDQPVIGNSLGPSSHVTAAKGYVRFHGRNYKNWFSDNADRDSRYDYLYSEEEFKPWKESIDAMRPCCDELYVIYNNHFRGQAVANAVQMKRLFGFGVNLPAALTGKESGPDL
ncbi:MAG: DUF72 domain-containing protein [bacterium]